MYKSFGDVAIGAAGTEAGGETEKAVLDTARPHLVQLPEGDYDKQEFRAKLKEYFMNIVNEAGTGGYGGSKGGRTFGSTLELTEMSAMGAGAVEGGGSAWSNFDPEENEREKPGGK